MGAGIGLHCEVARSLGFYKSIGFEPRKWACDYGRREFSADMRQQFADRSVISNIINAEKSKKVVIFTSHCLEHIVDPKSFLTEYLSENLEVDSDTEIYLFVAVPDVSIEVYSFFSRMRSKLWGQHMQSFSAEGLKKLAERAGFEVLLQEQERNSVRSAGVKLNYWASELGFVGLPIKIIGRLINGLGKNIKAECSVDLPVELRTILKIADGGRTKICKHKKLA